jgi:hypothetical protein
MAFSGRARVVRDQFDCAGYSTLTRQFRRRLNLKITLQRAFPFNSRLTTVAPSKARTQAYVVHALRRDFEAFPDITVFPASSQRCDNLRDARILWLHLAVLVKPLSPPISCLFHGGRHVHAAAIKRQTAWGASAGDRMEVEQN